MPSMRLLILGAGGVGSSACAIIARRRFTEAVVVADYCADRARAVVDRFGDDRFQAAQVDAGDESALVELMEAHRVDAVLNAVDPRFVMPIFRASLAAGVTYLDMAMSLSHPHAERPHQDTGVKLGDEQFALADQWEAKGRLALVGMGVEPGISDVFARHAADELFSRVDEVGVRDGANLAVAGYDFAPTFSIWTTIEECLNPPVIYERERGLVHHRAVQRAGDVPVPGGDRSGGVRERGARGGAARAPLGAGRPGHLQVRAGRRVHRGPPGAAPHRPGLDHPGPRGWRLGQPTRRGGRLPS